MSQRPRIPEKLTRKLAEDLPSRRIEPVTVEEPLSAGAIVAKRERALAAWRRWTASRKA